ncbi:MAG: hypothetical protein ACYSWX_04750 [Planctomycetota bacterium]|jgi:hypothetical protein
MKQILFVLLLAALAAGTFVFLKKLSEPAGTGGTVAEGTRTSAPGQSFPAPAQQRPNIPGARPEGPQMVTVEEARAQAAALPADIWHESAQGDLLVPAAEQWWLDLSGVDLTADPVLAWDGGSVSQRDFRRAVCSWLGAPLLEARATLEVTLAEARAAGVEPTLFDQELLDRRFELWCEQRGIDAEYGPTLLSLQYKLPAAAARELYDLGGQVVLAGSTAASRDEALFERFGTGLPDEDASTAMRELIQRVPELFELAKGGDDAADEALRDTLLVLDQIALFRIAATRGGLGQRFFTALDHELPDDAVAGVALGEVSENSIPWSSDQIAYIPLEEVWTLVSDFSLQQQESVLSDYAFLKVVEAALVADGQYETDEEAWVQWTDEFRQSIATVLGAKTLNVEFLGYPSLDVVRPMKRALRSFERAMGPDWRTEDDLRDFYERNRMLIESWNLLVNVAFFPAVAPEAQLSPPDWDRALEQAQALVDAVEAGGDFETLAATHSQELSFAYAQHRGEGAAQGFASVFGRGKVSQSLNELGNNLKLTYYQRLVRCGGSVLASVALDRELALLGPLRVPLGYVLLGVERVTLPGLEKEYEDAEYQTKEIHRDFSFMRWANQRMLDSGLTAASN